MSTFIQECYDDEDDDDDDDDDEYIKLLSMSMYILRLHSLRTGNE